MPWSGTFFRYALRALLQKCPSWQALGVTREMLSRNSLLKSRNSAQIDGTSTSRKAAALA